MPRPNTQTTENNPRPWEWRWWSQEEQAQFAKDKKIVPPLAAPIATAKNTEADDSATVQRVVERLPPEERAAFTRNLKRWAQMTMDERQTLRRQADERHDRIQKETDNALRESGLQLDDDRREMFMLRYSQERRKLERELQEKLAAERTRRTPELVQRLKREFEAMPAPTPSPPALAITTPSLAAITPPGPTVTVVPASPALTPVPHP